MINELQQEIANQKKESEDIQSNIDKMQNKIAQYIAAIGSLQA